jgi:hypothetical protein
LIVFVEIASSAVEKWDIRVIEGEAKSIEEAQEGPEKFGFMKSIPKRAQTEGQLAIVEFVPNSIEECQNVIV